jgi:hypothetical protein
MQLCSGREIKKPRITTSKDQFVDGKTFKSATENRNAESQFIPITIDFKLLLRTADCGLWTAHYFLILPIRNPKGK